MIAALHAYCQARAAKGKRLEPAKAELRIDGMLLTIGCRADPFIGLGRAQRKLMEALTEPMRPEDLFQEAEIEDGRYGRDQLRDLIDRQLVAKKRDGTVQRT